MTEAPAGTCIAALELLLPEGIPFAVAVVDALPEGHWHYEIVPLEQLSVAARRSDVRLDMRTALMAAMAVLDRARSWEEARDVLEASGLISYKDARHMRDWRGSMRSQPLMKDRTIEL